MDYVCNRCLFSIPSKIRFAFHFVERNQIITSDRSSHWTARSYSVATFGVKNTGKNNGFPILDILGYLKNTHNKSQIWESETNPNLGTWLGIPWLGFVSLSQIWDFVGIL